MAGPIPPYVLHLDLCTLVYQLYHQSLTWPLDPWYDVVSRVGSDRRTNTMKRVHEWAPTLGKPPEGIRDPAFGFYSGPSSARGWTGSNLTLDPVITNYKRINPKVPAFTRDGEKFLAAQAPGYIVDSIKAVEVARYKTRPTMFPAVGAGECEVVDVCDFPGGGGDHLIAFEGGTGITSGGDPSWSLMGFVLARKRGGDQHDVHLAFRGSRSGCNIKATVAHAQGVIGNAKGNADWVTDLDNTSKVNETVVSKVGQVTRGFSSAIKTMLGPILAGLRRLDAIMGPPKNVFVTGHSLGAALATQLTSAIALGSFGDVLRRDLARWPWDSVRCLAYALPITGDATWSSAYNLLAGARFIWVDGDIVVSGGASLPAQALGVGGVHGGASVKLPKIAGIKDDPHELVHIRGSLLRELASVRQVTPELSKLTTWAYYDTFANMLEGAASSYLHPGSEQPRIVTRKNLRSVLLNCAFGIEFDRFLDQVYARVVSDKSSYVGPSRDRTMIGREAAVASAIARMRSIKPGKDRQQTIDNLSNDLHAILQQLGTKAEEEFVGLGMVLSYFQRSDLTLEDLCAKPNIKKCVESKLNKA